MKKHKSENKKEKKKAKLDATKANITTTEQLLNCLQTKKRFRFDPNFTTLNFIDLIGEPLAPVIEVLNKNTTIRQITLATLTGSDLKKFVTCLTEHNRSVTKISMVYNDFEVHLMAGIAQILKVNEWIKVFEISNRATTEVSMEGFKIFCSNMEHYKFEELIISNAFLPADCYDVLLESLKTNRSIKSIKIEGETNLQYERLEKLCEILISNEIREYWHWGSVKPENYESFKQVLEANHLTKLKLKGGLSNTINIGQLAEEFKANTSITDLTIHQNPLDCKMFGEILSINKTIKKLELIDVDLSKKQLSLLNLGSNVTITDLTLISCESKTLDYEILFSELCQNQTLTRLNVESTSHASRALRKFLEQNHSLKELNITQPFEIYSVDTYLHLAKALSINKTLRKLNVKVPRMQYAVFKMFIEALKTNATLLELHMTKIRDLDFEHSPVNGNAADDFILDLLKSNKTLRFIEGASEYPYLEEKLKNNRDTQDQIIGDTCLLIKMIVTKPVSFILPIEIWLHVFEYLSYSFTDFDFAMFLQSLLK